MPRSRMSAAVALLLSAVPAVLTAEAPEVMTDIAPVHALVARVMEGTAGGPDLLLPPAASPHDYAMRPSDARALSEAQLVVWVGPILTPWLEEPLATLAPEAGILTLSDTPGTQMLPTREGALFGEHDHGEGESAQDDHDNHGGNDPHLWLDPRNASVWLEAIAEALATLDTENAALYRENAAAGKSELAALEMELSAMLAPVRGRPFLVAHDAYHHFEARFDIETAGALADIEALSPGAARLTEVRAAVAEDGIVCIFAEPQTDPSLLETAIEGSDARIGTLDPVGATLETGAGLYPALLQGMALAMVDCLSGDD